MDNYVRSNLRRKTLRALEKMPTEISKSNLQEFMQVSSDIMGIYKELTTNPFELLQHESPEEHKAISRLFANLMCAINDALANGIDALGSGKKSYKVGDIIVDVKKRLVTEAMEKRPSSALALFAMGD